MSDETARGEEKKNTRFSPVPRKYAVPADMSEACGKRLLTPKESIADADATRSSTRSLHLEGTRVRRDVARIRVHAHGDG